MCLLNNNKNLFSKLRNVGEKLATLIFYTFTIIMQENRTKKEKNGPFSMILLQWKVTYSVKRRGRRAVCRGGAQPAHRPNAYVRAQLKVTLLEASMVHCLWWGMQRARVGHSCPYPSSLSLNPPTCWHPPPPRYWLLETHSHLTGWAGSSSVLLKLTDLPSTRIVNLLKDRTVCDPRSNFLFTCKHKWWIFNFKLIVNVRI